MTVTTPQCPGTGQRPAVSLSPGTGVCPACRREVRIDKAGLVGHPEEATDV